MNKDVRVIADKKIIPLRRDEDRRVYADDCCMK
jgi:hypothetical protein